MQLHLLKPYCDLCERHRCTPNYTLGRLLKYIPVREDGCVWLDASALSAGEPFLVFLELLHELLASPASFLCPSSGTTVASSFPRLLRIHTKLSKRADNTCVEELSHLLLTRPPDPLAESQQQVPTIRAVVEEIDARGCVLVSLRGGRAFRNLARCNAYVRHIEVDGCSINPATAAHIAQATAQNRKSSRAAAEAATSSLRSSLERGTLGSSCGGALTGSLAPALSSLEPPFRCPTPYLDSCMKSVNTRRSPSSLPYPFWSHIAEYIPCVNPHSE